MTTGPSASVDIIGSDLKATETQSNSRPRGREALERAWIISNTSLILPFGLALVVCYYAYSAIIHELEASRAQALSMQAERTEFVKTLQAQNAKLSDLLTTHAGNADKALTEILVTVMESSSDRSAASTPSNKQ
jgi:hypothetical protein